MHCMTNIISGLIDYFKNGLELRKGSTNNANKLASILFYKVAFRLETIHSSFSSYSFSSCSCVRFYRITASLILSISRRLLSTIFISSMSIVCYGTMILLSSASIYCATLVMMPGAKFHLSTSGSVKPLRQR